MAMSRWPRPTQWLLGPAFGLAALAVIGIWAALSSPPLSGAQPYGANEKSHVTHQTKHDYLSLFSVIGRWAYDNRETIDPLTAMGALVAAGILAFVTGRLWIATRDLAKSTEDLAKGAEDQALEMKLARALAKRSIDLQEKQFALADRQCNLAEKQHDTERMRLLAEHRPRIAIRSIGITMANGQLFQRGRRVTGSMVIVNVGGSPAQIRQAEYRFFWGRSGLPMVPPLSDNEVTPLWGAVRLPRFMVAHESCLLPIKSDRPFDEDADAVLNGNGVFIYLMGVVLFADSDLQERWMGFCRKYVIRRGERRFVPVDNPDYEYED